MLILILICISPGSLWLESSETAGWARAEHYSFSGDSVQSHAAGSLPPPQITGSFAGSPVETRNGPVTGTLGVVQKLPWPGKLNTLQHQAELNSQISGNQNRMEFLRTRTEITQLWCVAYRHREYHALSLEVSQLMESLRLSASASVMGGYAGAGVLSDLHVRTEIAALTPITEWNLLLSSMNELESYTEINVEELSRIPDPEWFTERIKEAVSAPPAVTAAELANSINETELELSGIARLPEISAGFNWSFTGEPEAPGSLEFPGRDAWAISLSMAVPLGYSGLGAEERAAEYHLLSSQTEIDVVKRETYAQLDRYAVEIQNLATETALLQQLIPLAENSAQNASAALISGSGTYETLIHSLETVIDLKKQIVEKKISLVLTTARWLELAGLTTGEGEFL